MPVKQRNKRTNANGIQIIQKGIVNIIRRFKFQELESSVMTVFPEMSWASLKKELIKHQKRFTSYNVAQLIKIFTTEAEFGISVLRDCLTMLHLIDISWHSYRRMWYTYRLVGSKICENNFTDKELKINMENYFKSLNMQINIKVNMHNGIIYVSVVEKKLKKNVQKVQNTVFLALFVGHKYFFSTEKRVPSHILNATVRSLGFKKSERFELVGRDLKSLSELCWKRDTGVLNSWNITDDLKYEKAAPDVKETGIDFTQQEQRKKYVNECFGEHPPILESFVVHGINTPLAHERILTELSKENMSVTVEFRSHNVVNFLSKLIEQRVIVTPAPNYILNLLTQGKNQVTFPTEET